MRAHSSPLPAGAPAGSSPAPAASSSCYRASPGWQEAGSSLSLVAFHELSDRERHPPGGAPGQCGPHGPQGRRSCGLTVAAGGPFAQLAVFPQPVTRHGADPVRPIVANAERQPSPGARPWCAQRWRPSSSNATKSEVRPGQRPEGAGSRATRKSRENP